jgi:CheY-like chemotaxis protein
MNLVSPLRDLKPEMQSGCRSVLIVDDDRLTRTALRLFLEQEGFEVWLAANGKEAIHQYQEHGKRIGVVLLDRNIPDLDGPATLAALRELNADVQVCFWSGDVDFGLERMQANDDSYFVAKPCDLYRLASILQLLAGRVPGRPLPP